MDQPARFAIADADIMDDGVEAPDRVGLLGHGSHAGDRDDIADDDLGRVRKRPSRDLATIGVPRMQHDFMALASQALARHEPEAIRRSGDEDTSHRQSFSNASVTIGV